MSDTFPELPEGFEAVEDYPELPEGFSVEKTTSDDIVLSGLAGAAQGLTMGFSDEIWAGAKAGLKEVYEALGGPESNFETAYEKAVEENRAELERLEKKAPTAHAIGQISSILVPGLGLAKLAGTGKMIKPVAEYVKKGGLPGMVGRQIRKQTPKLFDKLRKK